MKIKFWFYIKIFEKLILRMGFQNIRINTEKAETYYTILIEKHRPESVK